MGRIVEFSLGARGILPLTLMNRRGFVSPISLSRAGIHFLGFLAVSAARFFRAAGRVQFMAAQVGVAGRFPERRMVRTSFFVREPQPTPIARAWVRFAQTR
jgi:hypothetical protein